MKSKIKLLLSEFIYKYNFRFYDRFSSIEKNLYNLGFSVENNFFKNSEIDMLEDLALEFFEKNQDLISFESNGSDRRIYKVDNYTSIFEIDKLNSLAYNLYKKFSFLASDNKFTLLGHITNSENNLGSGGGWHRDSPFVHQFKSIMYLTDVGTNNGPFQYIPGSHKFSSILSYSRSLNCPLSQYRFKEDEISIILENCKNFNIVDFTGEKGTVLFVDTRGLHRGKPIIDGNRIAITRYFLDRKNLKF